VQGLSPNTVYAFAALACAAAGAISDVRWRRIPDWVTGPGLVAGLLLHLALGDGRSLVGAALAAVLAGGVFLQFYLAGCMDAGDVKLMAAVCCLAGLSAVAQILAGAALTGGLAALFVAVFRWRSQHTLASTGQLPAHHDGAARRPRRELSFHNSGALRLPYGLAIAAGAACSVCNLFVR